MSNAALAHEILQKSFRRLQKKNPSYSMRALARDLELSPSYVSRIMSGAKPLPSEQAIAFASALKMDQPALVSLQKSTLAPELAALVSVSPVVQFEEETERDFNLLDEWYNIAIADLISCGGIANDPAAIAARIGVTVSEATSSLHRLSTHGYIVERDGVLEKTTRLMRFPTTRSHPSIRLYHRTMLKKAADALLTTDQSSFDRRSISGISIAANPANLARAKARLTEALYEVCEILREGEATEVYQLAAQLFPITK